MGVGKGNDAMQRALPRLSYAAFIGDTDAIAECLRQGDRLHQTVRLVNQNGDAVEGASPLYLAAQMGHYDACKLLLRAGADPLQACTVPATGQSFIAADIAAMHLHLRTWWLLKEAKRKLVGRPLSGLFRKGKGGGKRSRPEAHDKLAAPASQPSAVLILSSGVQMAI
ncbi:MAG: hypothetical protein J3K34DRAFT_400236 [Monoraphidium minutum]|nr:MAG: hypothetical protein J3K34DRAFT_400236 [Monoraphidium minutum]